jgi:CubicO group peptidase (beta-lactamase class C family)
MRVLALATLLLAPPAAAVPDAPKAPTKDALARSIESVVAPLAERGAFSGVVLIANGDDVLFEKAWGMASYELGVPNRPDTRFRIASITKRFTAIILEQLAAEKKLSLEEPLAKWAPEFPKADRITVAHLRDHRSGIRDPEKLRRVVPASHTAAEVVALLAKEPLATEPGEKHSYTTANYAVLSYVIERVEGAPFADVVRRRVYVPAGMKDAGDIDSVSVVPRLASGYMPDPYAASGMAVSGPEDTSWKTGGGSGYAAARDLHRFHRAFFGGKLLPAGQDPRTYFNLSKVNGRTALSSGGGFPGASAQALYFPDEGLSAVVLSNSYAPVTGLLAERAAAAALGEPVQPTAAPVRAEAAPLDPRIAGSFLVEGIPFPITFETSHGRAVATWNPTRVSALLRAGPNEWFMPLDWATLTLGTAKDGTPELTFVAPWAEKPLKVTRTAGTP